MGNGDRKVVDVKLMAPGTWASYVGAVTSVLNSRKMKCDNADVAGMSGYAFVVNINPTLCPSGPTAFDWEMLEEGTTALGLEARLFSAPRQEGEDERLAAELFEKVKSEIDEGRCCVVWGATCSPEFAIVYGYEDRNYLVRSFRTCRGGCARPVGPSEAPEGPVPFDKLESPGCFGVMAFGDATKTDRSRADRCAATRAVRLLRDRHPCYDPDYRHGAQAFRAWAGALERARAEVNPFGSAYSAQVYCELQGFAGDFCRRLAGRNRSASDQFGKAATALGRSGRNLAEVGGLFPFPEGAGLDDVVKVQRAAALLRECAELNAEAASALEMALGLM